MAEIVTTFEEGDSQNDTASLANVAEAMQSITEPVEGSDLCSISGESLDGYDCTPTVEGRYYVFYHRYRNQKGITLSEYVFEEGIVFLISACHSFMPLNDIKMSRYIPRKDSKLSRR